MTLFSTLLSQIPVKGRRNGDGCVSESKPDESVEQDGLDELDALRAEHALSSSAMGAAARARERLDEESTLRSAIRRERRMRISEMTDRVSGMQGAMRKANEILFEEQLQQIEADLRDELEENWRDWKRSLWRGRKDYFARRCYTGSEERRTDSETSWIWRGTGG